MKIHLLGTGGCQITPRPCCDCKICVEARSKGRPYERLGPSIFIEPINLLIDTPEEISVELNKSGIKKVEHIMFSHLDPDHLNGFRVVEQLNLDYTTNPPSATNNAIKIHLTKTQKEIVSKFNSQYGPFINYFEALKIARVEEFAEKFSITEVSVEFELIPGKTKMYSIIIKHKEKKIVLLLDDLKGLKITEKMKDPDLLIIHSGYFDKDDKGTVVVDKSHPASEDLFTFEETKKLISEIKAKKTILTHIEEAYGKSFDELKLIEKDLERTSFGFDGQIIKI